MIDKDSKLLTIKETLALSGTCRNQLYRDIKAGVIPAIYIGRNVRIHEKDALAYAEKKKASKKVQYYKNKDGVS